MGFQHIYRWNRGNLDPTKFYPVQSGEASLTDTALDVTISAIDTSKAWLEFTYESSSANDDMDRIAVAGDVETSTNIRFRRFNSTGTITIRWHIIEAKPSTPLTVQRFQKQAGNSNTLPRNETITSVDTTKAFPIISWRADTADPPKQNNVCRAKITSATNCEVDMNLTTTASVTCEVQVIENTSWEVQTGDFTFSGTNDSDTLSPAIPLADSYVTSSGEFDQSELDGNEVARAWQNSSTTMNFTRYDTSGSWFITWYVVDTKGDFFSQHKNQVIASGSTTRTGTLATAIDTARTFYKLNTPVLSFGNPDALDNEGNDMAVLLEAGGTPATEIDAVRNGSPAFETAVKSIAIEVN